MKYTKWLLLTLMIGMLSAMSTACLGKPRVFRWRNPLRQPPKIDLRPDSPLLISNPRYYSFMSLGSGVGGELHFEVSNRSDKLVHSYHCRYVPTGHGSYGSHPEEGLLPGHSRDDLISAHEDRPLTLTIDFVQFADGTTWFSNLPQSTIKPDGLRAGAKAAANYLLAVMSRDGVQAVMTNLPRIHADVRAPIGAANNPEFGIFGFYSGVTNTAVRVEHEYKGGGAERVVTFLRSYQE